MRIHEVTTRTRIEVDLDCRACGFAGTALVEAAGVGTATALLGSAEEAAEESAADAAHQARVTAGLVRCPRCHHRSRAAVAQLVVLTALGVAALLALAIVTWWLDAGLRGWLIIAVLLVAAAKLAWNKRRQLREAEASVKAVRPRAVLPRAVAVQVAPAPPDEPAPLDGKPRMLR
jgi:hypothetical protein